MPKVTVLINQDTGGSTFQGPAQDMVTSRASGQLLIAYPSPNGGLGYVEAFQLTQAPTITGPWTSVPTGGAIPGVTNPPQAVAIVPYTRSARYLQASVTGTGLSPWVVAAVAIEPPPPLSFTGP